MEKVSDMKNVKGKTLGDVSLGKTSQAMRDAQANIDVANPRVSLDTTETKIFDLLKKVADKHGTVVRVAGGWVRDKLLGKTNHDIDVSIEGMTGATFAKLVAQEMGVTEDQVGVIKANPEQSKHLETATMVIEGIPIDMVNLRSEKYTEARIPEMTMGTADEDASRRDLTINSLFFNLNTGKVEDKTGRGVEDLKNGVIRTPLEGVQTFIDDPLRTLRAIRFAARFGFDIHPDTMKAMSDPKVKEALGKKVRVPRMREELNGILLANPVVGMELLFDSGLSDKVIPELRALDMDQQSKYHDKTVFKHTMALLEHIHSVDPKNVTLKLAALLHDIGKPKSAAPNAAGGLSFIGKKDEQGKVLVDSHEVEGAKMAESVLRNFHYDKETIDDVTRLVEKHGFDAVASNMPPLRFGRWLRELAKTPEELNNLLTLRHADILASSPAYQEESMKEHNALVERLKKVDVPAILTMKPFVDGVELMDVFKRKPGKWVGRVNEQLLDLQLDGKIKSKEEARAYLEQRDVDDEGNLKRRAVSPEEAAKRREEAMRRKAGAQG
jgi:tRNA nucleotidyltransferase (CCA-adding enzyme)